MVYSWGADLLFVGEQLKVMVAGGRTWGKSLERRVCTQKAFNREHLKARGQA